MNNLNTNLDTVIDNLSPYEQQKVLGDRREDGSLNLKKLKPIHIRVIQMHLSGYNNAAISRKVQKTQVTISRWLSDPLIRAELELAINSERSRLTMMTGKAVDAVDLALESKDNTMKLKGVDRFIKLSDHLGDGEEDKITAEDIVNRIMNLNLNIQVNNVQNNG